jgi:hypothetical protein
MVFPIPCMLALCDDHGSVEDVDLEFLCTNSTENTNVIIAGCPTNCFVLHTSKDNFENVIALTHHRPVIRVSNNSWCNGFYSNYLISSLCGIKCMILTML